MRSYCVKQKKQTECVPGSERVTVAKNGSHILKCTCSECGMTKTSFIANPHKTKMGLISDRIKANANIRKLEEEFRMRKSKMSDDKIRSIQGMIQGNVDKRKKINEQLRKLVAKRPDLDFRFAELIQKWDETPKGKKLNFSDFPRISKEDIRGLKLDSAFQNLLNKEADRKFKRLKKKW